MARLQGKDGTETLENQLEDAGTTGGERGGTISSQLMSFRGIT